MSLLRKIAKYLRKDTSANGAENNASPELRQLVLFENDLNSLLGQDVFLSRKSYQAFVERHRGFYSKINSLVETKTLDYFCACNNIPNERIGKFLSAYQDIANESHSDIIEKHNNAFLSRHLVSDKAYLDGILDEVDPKIKLDEEQRRVVLSDDDYTLVVAGAGAGKTTTVAAKVKYLVEKKDIRPDQILVISFTNKAVGELRDKINKSLGIKCPVTTFHKTGYAILNPSF